MASIRTKQKVVLPAVPWHYTVRWLAATVYRVQVTAPEGLLPARQVELHLFFDALLEPQKSDIYQSVWRVVRLHTPKVCVRHFV